MRRRQQGVQHFQPHVLFLARGHGRRCRGGRWLRQGAQDDLADGLQLLAMAGQGILHFLHVSVRLAHHGTDLTEKVLKLGAALSKGIVQGREADFLLLVQAFELCEGEALEQGSVGFDLAAEEIADRDGQDRRILERPKFQELGQGREACRANVAGQASEEFGLGADQAVRAAKAGQRAGLVGQAVHVQVAFEEHTLLAGGPEVGETDRAKLGAMTGQVAERRRFEEAADLFAQGLVVAAGQAGLDSVPPRIAGQGNFNGVPGLRVGLPEGAGQALTVIGESLDEEVRDRLRHGDCPLDAERLAGAFDKRLEGEDRNLGEDAHETLR